MKKYGEWTARIVLGGVFAYAGMMKILHPEGFTRVLTNYDLLPAWALPFTAAVLPWCEFFLGLALFSGFSRRMVGTIAAGMLIVFMAAIGINLFRGRLVSCGCFSAQFQVGTFKDGIMAVLRDGLLLLPALYLMFWPHREKPGDVAPVPTTESTAE